ncbi:MAG: 50S ribosomal protein L24e [Candidatus Hodarchaeales archaeon]
MVRIYNCNFCGQEIEPGTGSIKIRKDGHVIRTCSRKCWRSLEMKRDPRKLKWTTKYEQKIKT